MIPKNADWIKGFKEGLREYAWWADGEQYLGTCGITLKQGLERVDEEYEPILTVAKSEKKST